ncbi:unnamed protein product, partial [Schistosoma intercalatum]
MIDKINETINKIGQQIDLQLSLALFFFYLHSIQMITVCFSIGCLFSKYLKTLS